MADKMGTMNHDKELPGGYMKDGDWHIQLVPPRPLAEDDEQVNILDRNGNLAMRLIFHSDGTASHVEPEDSGRQD